MDPVKESGAGAGWEKPTKIERDSREKVLEAFNFGYSLLDSPDAQLTPEEKWIKDAVKAAKEKTIDSGNDTFVNSFDNHHHTGINFTQDERIPTEGLIAYLVKLSEDEVKYPIGSQARKDLISATRVLFINSFPYDRFPERVNDKVKLEGRVHQEAFYIFNDLRKTGDEFKDWVKAVETINNRLELVIPAETEVGNQTSTENGTTPVAETAEPENNGEPSEPENTVVDTETGEPANNSTEQATERTLSSSYDVYLGSQNEDVRKLGERVAEMRIEERSSEGFPTRLPQNRILRVGRLIAHSFNPRNWGRILFTNMKEAYRQIWMDEHYRELRAANFGATNTISQEAARRALAEVKSLREGGKQVVERIRLGGLRKGEVGPTEVQGPLREYIINQVLKSVVPQLEPLLGNEAANQNQINGIENQIQSKLFEYVSAHQDDLQIREFFGRNATQYGDLSEFYASDIMETARRIIGDGRAQQFAQGQLDNIVKVHIFRATWGEQTEVRRTVADRLMSWAERNRVRGALINPATVGIATSALTFLAIRGGLGLSRVAVPVSGLITGSLYAALRNDWDLREQRVRVYRQQEAGAARERPGIGTRREIVERSLMNMATPLELINGGGQEIIAGGVGRKSIEEMKRTNDLEGLLRRRGEIYARLDYAKLPVATRKFIFFNQDRPSGIGLIKYESREKMEHGATALIKEAVDIDRILLENNFTPDRLKDSVIPWNEAFTQNRQDMDRQFGRYRLGSNLATAGGAALIGGTIGLGFQEAIAVGGRALGHNVGQTVLEGALGYHPETPYIIESSAGSIEAFRNIYDHGGSTNIGDHFKAVANPDHTLSIIDTSTNTPLPDSSHFSIDAQGHIKVSGEIPQSFRTELESKGFKISFGPDIVDQTGTQTIEKSVLGPNGEWTKHATNIDHREWYAYDQPGSQGNELLGYTFKNGNSVTLDMSHMELGFQHGLNPNPIDVQQVIHDGQAGIYVSTGDAQSAGLWIPDSADGVIDGKVTLTLGDMHTFSTPNGDMTIDGAYKMIVNQDALKALPDGNIATELNNRPDIWALNHGGQGGFIEYGRTVTQPDGKTFLQAFATIHGNGAAHETITTIIPGGIKSTIHTYDITPPAPVITEMPQEEPGIFPFPLGPREPLGPLESALFLYYGLGYHSREGLGWVPESEYTARRSSTLNRNPQARLDESQEVSEYLSRMEPAYREELERMDQTIASPMSGETRIVVTIPAFGEGRIIKKTLEEFLNQKNKDGSPLNPNLFEIIVYENDTVDRPKDDTEEQIRQFRQEHPEIKVHYAFKRWTKEDIDNGINTVGNARKYSCDLALIRSNKRLSHTGELIIVNNDADLEGIAPKYMADLMQEFDNKETLDYVVGKRNLPDWALKKPNIKAGQRLWETFDAVMRHAGGGGGIEPTKRKAGWPGMIGENSAMRASIYAAVGGYGQKSHLAEDQNLGDMIRVARQYDDKRFEYINRLQTYKNPRRYLTTIIMGKPLLDMYNDYHENKDVRNQNNQQLLSHIPDTFDIKRFELDADAFYQKKAEGAYDALSQEEFEQIFKRTMRFMGAKYRIENGHIKITDADRLIRGLGTTRVRSTAAAPLPSRPRIEERVEATSGTQLERAERKTIGSVERMLSKIKDAPPKGHPYFVESPPEDITLSSEKIRDLESTLPFFIPGPNPRLPIQVNPDVAPWLFDPIIEANDKRLDKAEKLTGRDSGLLALSAVSSETPEKQAKLYKALAKAIIKVHRYNGDLLQRWYESQTDLSKQLFEEYDQDRRSQRDKLVPPSIDLLSAVWPQRISELEQAISQNTLTQTHLRWVEFLSHSVKVADLIQIAKTQPFEETPATETPPQRARRLSLNIPIGKPISAVKGKVGQGVRIAGQGTGTAGRIVARGVGRGINSVNEHARVTRERATQGAVRTRERLGATIQGAGTAAGSARREALRRGGEVKKEVGRRVSIMRNRAAAEPERHTRESTTQRLVNRALGASRRRLDELAQRREERRARERTQRERATNLPTEAEMQRDIERLREAVEELRRNR